MSAPASVGFVYLIIAHPRCSTFVDASVLPGARSPLFGCGPIFSGERQLVGAASAVGKKNASIW
jgi:hypothetical protein